MNSTAFPLATLPIPKKERLYTLAAYLEREEKATELHEYYNGIITKLPMAKGPHNIIVANITHQLISEIKNLPKKYRVFGSQQLVYLPSFNYSVYPDVLAVAEMPQYWDNNKVLLINPLLIVDVLSKSTKKYDRVEKFGEYKTLESFQEYILIDPEKCHVETRFREEPNLWRDTIYTDPNGTITLKSLNINLSMAAIYEDVEV